MKNTTPPRREYGSDALLETNIKQDPFQQFADWFDQAMSENLLDANTMVLSTIDVQGYPDSRVVLLKDFSPEGFVFFTHYNSPKGAQMEQFNVAALNFYWREPARQVRIRGHVHRIPRAESEKYFASRPRESQLGALASTQSIVLRDRAQLEEHVLGLAKQYENKAIPCPETWGGYCVQPFDFEFFQGRDNRLNDRIRYLKTGERWKIERLSP